MTAAGDSAPLSLSCFLSSAFIDSDNAQIVHEILADLGVNVRTANDLPLGSDIASSIVDEILSNDFVCIVLATDLKNPTVWYEAGIAAGSRRPLLIVGESGAIDQLPFNLFSASVIRYRRDTLQVLRDSLTAYVRQVQPIAAQLKINWDRIETSEPVLTVKPELSDVPTEQTTQARIVEHFTQQGILAATYRQIRPDTTVDALIGFPALGDEFNTVLIEIKRNRSDERRDVGQVIDYMNVSGTRLAMLVYEQNSGLKPQIRTFGSFGIILIAADELLHWDYQRMARELAKLRNQIVHSN